MFNYLFIGSHYFEYYMELGDVKFDSVKLFINSILGDPEKYEYEADQSLIIKSKNAVFRFIHKWVNKAIHDKVIQDF